MSPADVQPAPGVGRPLGRFGRLALGALLVLGTALALAGPMTLLYFLSYGAVGALLVLRRPGNVVGWLLLTIGFFYIPTTATIDVDLSAVAAGTESTRDFLLSWISTWGNLVVLVGYIALSLLFPSGRLPSGRWRRPAMALFATCIVVLGLAMTAPFYPFNPDGRLTPIIVQNRLAIFSDLPPWSILPTDGSAILLVLALMAIGAGSLVVRYRRSTGILRLQLRWLVAAIAFVVLALVIGLSTLFVFGEASGGLGWIPAIVAYLAVPISIGVAVLRYRLYDIDRIISRTISYGLVTATLVAVYAGVILLLQAPLGAVTGGDTIAVATSTLVAFAVFQPLRKRIQTAVDRRFNRARYDAERTTAAFAAELRDEVGPGHAELALLTAVAATIRPQRASVWIRGESR
jgi:MFS family permease